MQVKHWYIMKTRLNQFKQLKLVHSC